VRNPKFPDELLAFWTAQTLEETSLHAYQSTIPPRYAEEDLEVDKADYEITERWGNNAGLTRNLLTRSLFPELRVGVDWTVAVEGVTDFKCQSNFFTD